MTAIDFAAALSECLAELDDDAPAAAAGLAKWRVGAQAGAQAAGGDGYVVLRDFVNAEEEEELLDVVYGEAAPPWHELQRRRLKNYGGFPHPGGMAAEALPEWLRCVADRVGALPMWNEGPINQVLLNEYVDGQGIAAHRDGPNYRPAAAVLSLACAATDMVFRRTDGGDVLAVPLPRRSLLVFWGDKFEGWTHEIAVRSGASAPPLRVSLTLRHAHIDPALSTLTAEGRAELARRKARWIRAVTDAQ